jgi:hypothetical protein
VRHQEQHRLDHQRVFGQKRLAGVSRNPHDPHTGVVDPSFAAPISANLFDCEDGEGLSLIWSRPNSHRNN